MVLSTANTSSIPTAASVIGASVVSGSISEIAPTNVVLPTPNPPLMTIFTVAGRDRDWSKSEGPDTVSDPFDHVDSDSAGVLNRDVSRRSQIGNQHSRHPQRHRQRNGDLGDRTRRLAQRDEAGAFEHQRRVECGGLGGDQCFDSKPVLDRLRAATRDQIRPDDGSIVVQGGIGGRTATLLVRTGSLVA